MENKVIDKILQMNLAGVYVEFKQPFEQNILSLHFRVYNGAKLEKQCDVKLIISDLKSQSIGFDAAMVRALDMVLNELSK